MRKKTLITMAVVTTMSLSLAACNRTSPSDSASSGAKSAKSATLVISTLNNPFFVSVADGAKAKAKTLGMTIDVQNANNADQASLDLASAALNKKPSVLIMDPVSSASGGSIVTLATTAGVPVVAFDRMPKGGDLKAFIGYDAIQAGKNGAKALGEALGGKGKIVEIQGIMGTSVAQERSKGFNEGIKAFPGIKIVATQPAEFDRGKALNVMTNVLQSNRDINGVYAAQRRDGAGRHRGAQGSGADREGQGRRQRRHRGCRQGGQGRHDVCDQCRVSFRSGLRSHGTGRQGGQRREGREEQGPAGLPREDR
jgi:ribose transport system substrate-binding protein